MEDPFLNYFALGLLFFVVTVLVYGIIAIHDIPARIAHARHHPHEDAIHAAGWISLFMLRGWLTNLGSNYFGVELPVVAGWSRTPRLSSRRSSRPSWRSSRRSCRSSRRSSRLSCRSSRRSSRRSIPGVCAAPSETAKSVAGSATPISENAVRREISPDWIPSVMSNLLGSAPARTASK